MKTVNPPSQPSKTTTAENGPPKPQINPALLEKSTERYQMITVGILILGILLLTVFQVMGYGQLKRISALRQELAGLESSRLQTQAVSQYLLIQQENLAALSNAFPNEETIVDALTKLETLVRQADPEGQVRFSALSPTKIKNELTVPLIIKAAISPGQSMELLRKIEKLPYILEVTHYEARTPEGVLSPGEITIGARLYVQDPFSASK